MAFKIGSPGISNKPVVSLVKSAADIATDIRISALRASLLEAAKTNDKHNQDKDASPKLPSKT